MGIGKILLELVEQKRSNVNEISKLAGVSPSTLYSMIKRDNMKVDIEVLIKVSDALGVDVEYFYEKYKNGEISNKQKEVFTQKEIEHIKKYRALNELGQQTVDNLLDNLHQIATAQQESSALDMVAESVSPYGVTRQEAHRIVDQEFDAAEKGKTPEASSFTKSLKEEKIG